MNSVKNILVPTDFSEYSSAALDHATALASLYGAKLHLIHVQAASPRSRKAKLDAIKGMKNFTTRWLKSISVDEQIVRTGHPHQEIVRYANEKKIDLIVMATHGRTGLVHMLMGSVAEKVVRYSPVSVLCIKPPKVREWLITRVDVEEELHFSEKENSN
jgi:universal stress protein A